MSKKLLAIEIEARSGFMQKPVLLPAMAKQLPVIINKGFIFELDLQYKPNSA